MGQYKNPENPRSNFSPIVGNFQLFPGKILLFPKNPNFSRKNDLLSAKISYVLFLVINSKISNFPLFLITTRHFPRKSINNFLLFGKTHKKTISSPEMR